jgi:hypothetical protein
LGWRPSGFHGIEYGNIDGQRTMTNQQWHECPHSARLERRYDFQNYEALRRVRDDTADLSERGEGRYTDMGFARDYMNNRIHADGDSNQLADKQRRFARLLDALLQV